MQKYADEQGEAVRITAIATSCPFDATEAIRTVEKHLHRQEHRALMERSGRGKDHGLLETNAFLSKAKLIICTRWSSLDGLRAHDKTERQLMSWLQGHVHVAGEAKGSGPKCRAEGESDDVKRSCAVALNELVGVVALRGCGSAEPTEGPLPCLWTHAPLRRRSTRQVLQHVRSPRFRDCMVQDERLASLISYELILCTDPNKLSPRKQVVLRCILNSEENMAEVKAAIFSALADGCDDLLHAPLVALQGEVDWSHHVPARKSFSMGASSAGRFVKEKYPTFKQQMVKVRDSSVRSVQGRAVRVRRALSVIRRYGATHPATETRRTTSSAEASEGHFRPQRLKLASPIRQSLLEKQANRSRSSCSSASSRLSQG